MRRHLFAFDKLKYKKKHPERANLRHATVLNFVVRHISCLNYFGEEILNQSKIGRFWTLNLTSQKLIPVVTFGADAESVPRCMKIEKSRRM